MITRYGLVVVGPGLRSLGRWPLRQEPGEPTAAAALAQVNLDHAMVDIYQSAAAVKAGDDTRVRLSGATVRIPGFVNPT